jgi:ribonuclease J
VASLTQTDSSVKLVALGGLGEIGLNLMVLESAGEAMVIDAGVVFPEQRLLGADVMVPDLSYLAQLRIRGVVLTHAHDDHVGALPFLLDRHPVPVYGSALALAVARQRLLERSGPGAWDMRTVSPGQRFDLGPFTVEPVRVTHSTPDSLALAIDSPAGMIVHTGDFKIDDAPVDGVRCDLDRFAQLGQAGVTLLLSDSTNAERRGRTVSESSIKPVLRELMGHARGKVLLSAFSSHLHRFRQFAEVCHEQGRRVAVLGRRMAESARLGASLGHLPLPAGTLIDEREIQFHYAERLGFLATGSQAEPLSAMVKIATGTHPRVRLSRGDAVILSSRFIPGNERLINRMINNLFKQGADVFYEGLAPVHVSGHACGDELIEMMRLVRPRFFVPIHGEYRHLKLHVGLAREFGMPAENCFLLQNGEILELSAAGARQTGTVPVGRLFIDGRAPEPEELLSERERLAHTGVLAAFTVVERGSGELLAGPELISRGFLSSEEMVHLRRAREQSRVSLMERLVRRRGIRSVDEVGEELTRLLRAYFSQEVGRLPTILPWVVEV